MKTPWRKLYILSTAGGFSWLGSALTTFAVILRDKDAIGASGVSGYLLAFGLPTIFMAPISGLIADKFSSRQVTIPALAIMGLSSGSLAMGWPIWWTPLALLITATAGTLVGPAMQAAEVSVTAPEDLPRVSGLMQSMASFGTLFAPALGGILVSTSGYFWPFVIDAISFWLLALVFLSINLNRKPVKHEVGEKLSSMAGIRFVFGDRLIRALVVLVAVLVTTLGSFNVGEVFLVKDELHASDLIYGIVSASFAAGSILGALATAAIKLSKKFHAIAVIGAIGVLVLTILGFSLAPHWWVVIVMSAIAGIANSVLNAYAISIIMTSAPREMLGRVNAAIGAFIQTGSVAGIVLAGIAINTWGVRPVMLASSILAGVVLVIFGPDVVRFGRGFTGEKAETANA